ncbi:YbaN family protein [Cupriavidus sp. CuC1]|uniref:YbaN family protein n=1 Tax=Cupriavidus sp. CuC1 TaxID=3373131 RepID=UPI0037D2DDFF
MPSATPAPCAIRSRRQRALRALWVVLGVLSLGLGTVGIFLPVLPTTPFVLLAAACFARGSERFHARLLAHPRFGPPVRDWQAHRSIPLRAKQLAIGMMWLSMGATAWLMRERSLASLTLVAIAAAVSAWLLWLPTRPAGGHAAPPPGRDRTQS